jgi:hypothetical protein
MMCRLCRSKARSQSLLRAHSEAHGQWKKGIQAYLASIHFADAMLGRVLDALEKSPQRDNTIVVLWSDHGWHLGEKEHWQKFTGWRACARVPLMVRVPKGCRRFARRHASGLRVLDRPVSLVDLFATLTELCGLPAKADIESRSLVPLLARSRRRMAARRHHPSRQSRQLRPQHRALALHPLPATTAKSSTTSKPIPTNGPTSPASLSTPKARRDAFARAKGDRSCPQIETMNIVSIFNDVIGPVMRGPSSSHCAAALRIGRLARDLMDGEIAEVLVEFDRAGSLPTTHESQGSDMGLFGGLLGWEADDERLPNSAQALAEAGIKLRIETVDVGDPHPNTYRLTLKNSRETHTLIAISTGGGMIEVIRDRWRADAHGRRVSRDADLVPKSDADTPVCTLGGFYSQRQTKCLHHSRPRRPRNSSRSKQHRFVTSDP